MGTSKLNDSPKWPGVNKEVGKAAREGPTKENLTSAIGAFTSAYKGYLNSGTTDSSGTGYTAGRQSTVSSTARRSKAASSGARLADFLTGVAYRGLNQELDRLDLSNLVGRPLEEVLDAILDKLCEDGDLLDDVALTNAMARTLDELAEEARTVEDFDQLLSEGVKNVEKYLQIYYANILAINFEQKQYGFVREHVPREKCDDLFKEATELIRSIVNEELSKEYDLTSIDWNSKEGITIADSINQEVLDILVPDEHD